jgi:hypothetical protein
MASEYNPLLEDFVFPPFDVIEPRHVRPAILSLLKKLVRIASGSITFSLVAEESYWEEKRKKTGFYFWQYI